MQTTQMSSTPAAHARHAGHQQKRTGIARLVGASLLAVTAMAATSVRAADAPTVFAAASMKTALDAIAGDFARETGTKPVISYGSSGTLAKQIEAGAPADLFISADQKWMDDLASKGLLDAASRENLLGNSLVLVSPAGARPDLTIKPGFDLAGTLGDGKLAVCLVASCPAGIYGKEALQKLGVYSAVEPKLAQAENVRAALLLVARGEAKLGIVYATDARAEPKVAVVGTFPESSHTPIVYPVARIAKSKNEVAARFEEFLRKPAAAEILKQQGFTLLPK